MIAYYRTVVAACEAIAADPTEREGMRRAARETAAEYREMVAAHNARHGVMA